MKSPDLTVARDVVAGALAALDAELGKIETDRLAVDKLKDEAGGLRDLAGEDLDAATRLAGVENQIQALSVKTVDESIKRRIAPLVASLQTALNGLVDPLQKFLADRHSELITQIAGDLKPYCSPSSARTLAAGTDASQRLLQYARCDWRIFGTQQKPRETAQTVLAFVNRLCDGQIPWLTP
jgi:hypothetical protein